MPPVGYSTNLHAAETLDEIVAVVVPAAESVRRRLGWRCLGIDLRLGLAALRTPDWSHLRRALDHAKLSAHTLNGFPLLPFQAGCVKEDAYRPDWSEAERLTASMQLLAAAFALSDEPLVTISTVPGSFKPFGKARNRGETIAAALGTWAAAAARAERTHGRRAVLCLEPEPWCTLETSAEAIAFWRGPLATAGVHSAADGLDGDLAAGRAAVARHLGLCFDTCHASLAFEDQAAAVAALTTAGVPIPKCQFSAAPEAGDRQARNLLAALHEPRFLHQVAVRDARGTVHRALDLDRLDDLVDIEGPLRAHFHIPVDREHFGALRSTVAESRAGLVALAAAGCTHVAVETYTWSLLAAYEEDRLAGTARELASMTEAMP